MKNVLFLLAVLTSTIFSAYAQDVPKGNPKKNLQNGRPFITDIDNYSPYFPGGDIAFMKYVEQHMKFPAEALQRNIFGTVYVSFTVDSLGYIKDPKVERSLGYGCDEEAIRLISEMPKWVPGKTDGAFIDKRVVKMIRFIKQKF